MSANETTEGWVPSVDGRGTIDIIWTCVLTISLCCWTSVCVNIPALTDNRLDKFRDKFNLACLGILGPDFLFILALGQWESAQRSVKKFHAANYPDWTMKHAFFADMGGFVLQTPDFPPFPLDAGQLYYMVSKGYLEYPDYDVLKIDDANKSDGLARFLTVIQVLIFSITCIARAVQHLTITTIELTTLAFVFAMLATSVCWRFKPQDISRPVILKTDTTIADILIKAGDVASRPYSRTPLDFVDRQEWIVSVLWIYYTELLRKMHMRLFSRNIKARPIDRIRSDNFPVLSPLVEILCGVYMIVYSAIFVAGWNSSFPSKVENILWNISSLIMLGFASIGGVFFFCADLTYFHKKNYGNLPAQQEIEMSSLQSRRYKRVAANIRNFSEEKDPALSIPIRILLPSSILCALYSVARAYILIEDVIGLRSLPSAAFNTVDWSQYMPHL